MRKRLLPALLTCSALAAVFLIRDDGLDEAAAQPKDAAPISMAMHLKGVQIEFGLKDAVPTEWTGEVSVSPGKIVSLDVVQGNPKAAVKGAKFDVKTTLAKKGMKKDVVNHPSIRVTIDAPSSAKVKVVTNHGAFEFPLDELPFDGPGSFLKNQVHATRESGAVKLTAGGNEHDYPSLAVGADGAYWLAYSEYQHGQPYIRERVLAGNFEDLEPQGNGDRIRLQRFDGTTWGAAIDVTDGAARIWRPSVAAVGGKIHVTWAQQVGGDFEVFHRVFTPPIKGETGGRWTAAARVTNHPGSDFNVVSTSAPDGRVWLAWQSWDGTHFQIKARALDANGLPAGDEIVITQAKANHWNPSIAADSKGNILVAYDDYEKGNYDVRLARIGGKDVRTIDIATSARFEARPHIAVDKSDRVWIAYEEGDEQWGKDYSNAEFKKIGLKENPGNALYLSRTVQVKCVVGDAVQRPAADLQAAIGKRTARSRSSPRIAIDGSGMPWVFYRHHPKKAGVGEVWVSFGSRFDGKAWSAPTLLAQSENLMDNRPAFAPFAADKAAGLIAVYSGDGRTQQLNRKRDHLFASAIVVPPTSAPPTLEADAAPPAPKMKNVHPNEAADIARIRAHRIEHDGKKLHLYRGEFHRHTEYTAHRDGDGMLEDSWRYAFDAAGLDWMGNADHDNGHHDEYSWWQIQKLAEALHNPPHFVALHSYERSNVYPNGHRNVILPRPGIRPLPRGDLKGTEETGTPDTKILYKYLKFFGGICSSHTSATGMGTDWRDNDPVYEPIVEIYQGHRHNYEYPGAPRSPTKQTQIGGFEPKGFVNHALDKGYKLGFQSSSDHISTHLSYGMVLTEDLSRQGIIDAFKRRHSYGATDNIILDVRSGGHLMGDIFDTAVPPTFDIQSRGTAPIARVLLIRDGKIIYTVEPKQLEVAANYTDRDAEVGRTSYYYVRIEQADGNLAWASPMWITYRGK